MTDIYVSFNGKDISSGTAANPKRTIPGAEAIASDGDRILLEYHASLIHGLGSSFTTDKQLTYITYGGGSGQRATIGRSQSGSSFAFYLDSGAEGTVFENIRIYENLAYSNTRFFHVLVPDVTWRDVVAEKIRGDVIRGRGNAGNFLVEDCVFAPENWETGDASDGLNLQGTSGNFIEDITVRNSTFRDIDHSVFQFKWVKGFTCEDSTFYDTGGKIFNFGASDGKAGTMDGVVKVLRNTAYNIGSKEDLSNDEAKPHGFADVANAESTLDVEIAYNVIYDLDAHCIEVGHSCDGSVNIHHNTFSGWGRQFGQPNSGGATLAAIRIDDEINSDCVVTIKDNIFNCTTNDDDFTGSFNPWIGFIYDTSSQARDTSKRIVSHNIFNSSPHDTVQLDGGEKFRIGATNYTAITSFISGETSLSANSLNVDPLFTDLANNNYNPQSTSQALGNGSSGSSIGALGVPTLNVASIVSSEIAGNPSIAISGGSQQSVTGSSVAGGEAFGTASLNIVSGTIAAQVSAGADDADQTPGGDMDLTRNYLRVQAENAYVGMRFGSISIESNQDISSATLQIYLHSTAYDDAQITIYGEDADDGGTFTSTSNDISDRTKTTAFVTVSQTGLAAGGALWYSIDVTAIVEEITERAGWSSGNDLNFIVVGNSGTGLRWRSYEHTDPTQASKLNIILTTTVTAPGVLSGETLGTATLSHSMKTSSIATTEALGVAELSQPNAQQDITTSAIATAEALGVVAVSHPVSQSITTTAIAAAETFGASTVAHLIEAQPAANGNNVAYEVVSSGFVDAFTERIFLTYNNTQSRLEIAGIRIPNLQFPGRKIVTYAAIEFTAYLNNQTNQQDTNTVTIYGEDESNAAEFFPTGSSISTRDKTSGVVWETDEKWSTNNRYLTNDIKDVVNSIVNRSDWAEYNAVVFIIEGDDTTFPRIAYGLQFGEYEKAPKLIVHYIDTSGLFPASIDDGNLFSIPGVNPGPVSAYPLSMTTAEAFGTAAVGHHTGPAPIESQEAVSTGAEIKHNAIITGVESTEAFGVTALSVTSPIEGVESAEAFGAARLSVTIKAVSFVDEAAGGAFGVTGLTVGINPSSILTEEATGDTVINNDPRIFPDGITSAEIFGTVIIASFKTPRSRTFIVR